jgi:prepilin-type processing-associated H-X9-DG protein
VREDGPIQLPRHDMGRGRRGLTIVELLIVGALVVTVVGLLIPALLRIRATAERNQCSDNLRRIGMALHAFHDAHNSFPIACDMNPSIFGYSPKGNLGRQKYWMLSWSTRILPFLEQDNLYRQMDIAQDDSQVPIPNRYYPFDNNRFVALGVSLPVFHCPSDSRSFVAETSHGLLAGCTSYLGVSGVTTMGSQLGMAPEENPTDTRPWETDPETGRRTGCDGVIVPKANTHNPGPAGVRVRDIDRGLGNAFMLGERPPSPDLGLGWIFAGYGNTGVGDVAVVLGISERATSFVEPTLGVACARLGDADARSSQAWKFESGSLTNFCDALHFWSLHSGGGHFAMADGSVRFCSYEMSPTLQRAMATRSKNEASREDLAPEGL